MIDTLPSVLNTPELPQPKIIGTIAPPEEVVKTIRQSIEATFKELPPNAKGGIFMAINETQANIVIATKAPGGIQIQGYVGRYWEGSTKYGINVMKTW